MKARIKYYLSKLFVLILALRILDVSIDVDFAASSMPVCLKNYDDIDSASEFIFEKIFNNDNLFAEREKDEQQQDSSSPLSRYSFAVYHILVKNEFVEPAIISISTSSTYALKNVTLFFEDHSGHLYIPPDKPMYFS